MLYCEIFQIGILQTTNKQLPEYGEMVKRSWFMNTDFFALEQ